MPFWMQWFQILYPIALTMTPVLIAVGLLWLRTKFASLGDFKAIETKVAGVDFANVVERLGKVETSIQVISVEIQTLSEGADSAPTRLDLMHQLSGLSERMSRMEAAVESERRQSQQQHEALRQQLATANQYLHTLIDQGMRGS